MTATLNKVVDTIRSLTSPSPSGSASQTSPDRISPLSTHLVIDDGRPYLEYLFNDEKGWEWNRSKYRTESRTLTEIVDGLVKESQGIENAQRNKSQSYALVKGQLAVAARRQKYAPSPPLPLSPSHVSSMIRLTPCCYHSGNLSVRSMAEVVSAEDFAATSDSEYLETILVAVPK